MRKVTSLLTLLCMMMSVSAQEHRTSRFDSIQHVHEVEVTGTRHRTLVTATRPVQQMGKAELEQLGLQSLADAVKHFAGANVRDYGGIGGMKTVSVRNLGAHHTAVSYDGLTISNTQAGQIDIGHYALDRVQTLSFSIGEQTDLMQTARHYASAGVLSIETERPHFDDGHPYSLRLRVRGGSFGMMEPSLQYWHRLGATTSLSADVSYMRADGIYPFTLVNGEERTRERRQNCDIYSLHGEANLYHTFRDSSQLDVKAYWYYSERGLPGAVILYNNKSNERLWDEDFFAQASYRKQLSRQWQLRARMKYVHSWNQYEDTDVKYQDGKQTDTDRQDEYYASATLGYSPMRHLSLALAEDVAFNWLRNNIPVGANTDPARPRRFTSLTALTARYQVWRVTLDGHLVATYATEHVNAGTTPDDRRRLSPSISFSFQPLASQSLYVRAMQKNTFRLPTFNDLYYRRMGNVALRPEKASEYNVGLAWNGSLGRHVRYLAVTVDGYYNDVTDKIVAFPSTYIWRMANFGRVKIHGVDLTLATEVPIYNKVDAVLTTSYTWQKAVDKTEGSKTYGSQLPYTPMQSGNASLLLNNPWVNVGYSLLWQGHRWSMAQNTPEYRLDSYMEHTLTLSREFRLRRLRLHLQATVKNLTNEQYSIIHYYPMPGRSWSMTATIHL